jgi:hypothetical protein
MPEQTVKHDDTASGFLLVLIPVAFFAVFVSIAWPYIVGATLLFTGNKVWQSYQLAKLSQQVNPLFHQLIIERQGSITPLELSARANISGQVANRYLYGKAIEFGGTSQQSSGQGLVYNFLTVNSLENVFAGINPNPTASQKLAEFDRPAAPVVALPSTPLAAPMPEQSLEPLSLQLPSEPITDAAELPLSLEVAAMPTNTVAVNVEAVPAVIPESIPATVIELVVPETTVELITEPVVNSIADPVLPVVTPVTEPATDLILPVSSFGQALRNIFNAENVEDEAEVALEQVTSREVGSEIISQSDLAKRLDVHASTIYKRRADVSFGEWTRNRDPEGIAWGYYRDSKEFYRLG